MEKTNQIKANKQTNKNRRKRAKENTQETYLDIEIHMFIHTKMS